MTLCGRQAHDRGKGRGTPLVGPVFLTGAIEKLMLQPGPSLPCQPLQRDQDLWCGTRQSAGPLSAGPRIGTAKGVLQSPGSSSPSYAHSASPAQLQCTTVSRTDRPYRYMEGNTAVQKAVPISNGTIMFRSRSLVVPIEGPYAAYLVPLAAPMQQPLGARQTLPLRVSVHQSIEHSNMGLTRPPNRVVESQCLPPARAASPLRHQQGAAQSRANSVPLRSDLALPSAQSWALLLPPSYRPCSPCAQFNSSGAEFQPLSVPNCLCSVSGTI
ncbi:hypothetical protein NDU88_003995 [Pleurodeles waltl]|uniref:Uncharacterized protein n=1 Tax=Pleurodeles waltl TaxID=8319 RepID=A0AAV7QE99_PLEWA|nr:hypothetical protein NDU88_003995 [Pleurodeles waltl]